MSAIGVTEIVLIIVSLLLLICVVTIAVILVSKKRNVGKRIESHYETPPEPVNIHQDNYQDFTVLKRPQESRRKSNNSPFVEEESSHTVSIGVKDSFRGGGVDPFFCESSDNEDKTEVMLGGDVYPSKASSYGHSGGITIQYHKNGVLQNYRMTGEFAIIGREQGCDILIDSDNYMSEQHAILFVRNRAVYVADFNSKNGTYVNDKRVKGVMHLSGKDKLKVASSEIKVIIH